LQKSSKSISILLTIFLGLLAPVLQIFPATGVWLEWNRDAIARGQVWRLVAGHWVHWSFEHFFWSAGAFALLLILCARISVRKTLICVLLSSLAIGGVLFLTKPHLARGLSGIDSALFMLLAISVMRNAFKESEWWRAAVGAGLIAGFIAKIAYEATTGNTVFASSAGMVVASLAHATGAVIGALVCLIGEFWLPIRLHLTKMPSRGAVWRKGFWWSRMKKSSRSSSLRSCACADCRL
jgi:rhomboid family GlyGly-CTERM serine protease